MDLAKSDTSRVLENYVTSSSVRARWELYRLAKNYVDVEQVAYAASIPDDHDVIADIGSSDGMFLDKAHVVYGHTGTRIAIDIKPGQFARSNFTDIPSEVLDNWLKKYLPTTQAEIQSSNSPLMKGLSGMHFLPVAGDVASIPLKSESVDRLFELFMLYHVPPDMLSTALFESKRIMKDTARFVIATSGVQNKAVHREIEAEIADRLGVSPPAVMNKSFTTEAAEETLPAHFDHVQIMRQETDIQLESNFDIELYIHSQRSMYNQYYPVPDLKDFEQALEELRVKLTADMLHKGRFVDRISRGIFVVSTQPMLVPVSDGFKSIS